LAGYREGNCGHNAESGARPGGACPPSANAAADADMFLGPFWPNRVAERKKTMRCSKASTRGTDLGGALLSHLAPPLAFVRNGLPSWDGKGKLRRPIAGVEESCA